MTISSGSTIGSFLFAPAMARLTAARVSSSSSQAALSAGERDRDRAGRRLRAAQRQLLDALRTCEAFARKLVQDRRVGVVGALCREVESRCLDRGGVPRPAR